MVHTLRTTTAAIPLGYLVRSALEFAAPTTVYLHWRALGLASYHVPVALGASGFAGHSA